LYRTIGNVRFEDYIEAFGGRFDFFVLEREVDAGSTQESHPLSMLLALGDHELDGGLGVPILVEVCFLFVLGEEGVESVH
jgi:hypothetical protein